MIKKLSVTLGISTLLVIGFASIKETNKREVAGFMSHGTKAIEVVEESDFEKMLKFSPKYYVNVKKSKFEIEKATL